ncbi:MAG: hypothetical protein ACLQNE_18710 [Thermoguttaceae bacterium]
MATASEEDGADDEDVLVELELDEDAPAGVAVFTSGLPNPATSGLLEVSADGCDEPDADPADWPGGLPGVRL